MLLILMRLSAKEKNNKEVKKTLKNVKEGGLREENHPL
jgi:hypothetical protein